MSSRIPILKTDDAEFYEERNESQYVYEQTIGFNVHLHIKASSISGWHFDDLFFLLRLNQDSTLAKELGITHISLSGVNILNLDLDNDSNSFDAVIRGGTDCAQYILRKEWIKLDIQS